MVAWLRISVAVVLTALLGACAQLPSAAKIKQFSGAVDKTASVYSQGIDFNREINEKIGVERGAANYIRRAKATDKRCKELAENTEKVLTDISLREAVSVCDFDLPPLSARQISEENRKLRLNLINAIAGYAKALGEASDQGAIDNVQAAVSTLGAAVGAAATPIVGAATVPIVTPVIKIASRGVGLAVGNAYAVEIRQLIGEAHEPLKEAVRLLKISIAEISKDNNRKLTTWITRKKANLNHIAQVGLGANDLALSSRSQAYGDFRTAVAEARDLQTKANLLNGYSKVLDAMVAAHEELLNGDAESPDAIAKFSKWADDFAALAPLLKSK